MIKDLGLPSSIKVNDFGCGDGYMARILKENGYMDVSGFDASTKLIDLAQKENLYKDARVIFLG